MLQQDLLRGLRHAQRLQSRGIAEQCEVALVGVQRMGLRMRRQHDPALQIRFAQRGASGLLQVEVGQPVVDQVDGQVAMPQRAAAPFERGRVGDDRAQAMPLEQLLEQQELGVEVLVLGSPVDDGDARQRPRISAQAGQTPFVAKHLDDAVLEGCHGGQRGHHPIHRRAAGPLCPRQHGVEHRPAGVGVDLDQPQVTLIQVKVVAEEDAQRPCGAQPGDGRRGGQHLLPIGRQGHDRFDGLHDLRHALQLQRRHEHGLRGEKERATQSNHLGEARLAEFGVERSRQRAFVETEAEARVVECFGRTRGHSDQRR